MCGSDEDARQRSRGEAATRMCAYDEGVWLREEADQRQRRGEAATRRRGSNEHVRRGEAHALATKRRSSDDDLRLGRGYARRGEG